MKKIEMIDFLVKEKGFLKSELEDKLKEEVKVLYDQSLIDFSESEEDGVPEDDQDTVVESNDEENSDDCIEIDPTTLSKAEIRNYRRTGRIH